MSLSLTGCAYRLYAPSPASRHTLTVVAKSPEQYDLRVFGKAYKVAADGSVAFEYPRVRRVCGITFSIAFA